VLAICRGQAKVQFGGSQGVTLTVQVGDVVLIPAGVGYENLGASADLLARRLIDYHRVSVTLRNPRG
jgi:uncharacterized protein YjlB